MPFVAGQFVNVEVPGTSATRSYSMANAPDEPDVIELIVKILPNGVFSGYLEAARPPPATTSGLKAPSGSSRSASPTAAS